MTEDEEENLILQEALSEEEREEVIGQLRLQNLPADDISEETQLYLLWSNEEPIGTAGLEQYGTEGLLRSISVQQEYRGQGLGQFVVEALEAIAASQGILAMNLLTETAEPFFSKLGYKTLPRTQVPEAIKGSSEFAHVCPASAAFMRKCF